MKKNLTLIILLGVLLILVGVFYWLYKSGKIIPRAVTEPTISLSSSSTTYQVNQQFPVFINADSAGQDVFIVDVHSLNYDPNFLEFVNIQPSTMFPLYQPPQVDTTQGTISLMGMLNPGDTDAVPVSGTFATVTFKATQPTASTALTWDLGGAPLSATGNIDFIGSEGQDILVNAYETFFTITGVPTPVSVDIKANGQDGPLTVTASTTINLSWTSANATACSASNGWSGDKATSGSESIGTLTESKTFTLTCSSAEGSNSDSVAVNVSTGGGGKKPTPRETPPTEPPTQQPTEQPTQEPTEEPTAIPTEISYVTPTITPTIITSPAAGSPSPKVSPSPTPKFSPSPSPTTKVGGFAISPTIALLLYIGIPVVITLGVFYFWWRRRQKGGIPPPPDEDEWI